MPRAPAVGKTTTQGRSAPLRATVLALVLAVLGLSEVAQARTVKIVTADRLELRKVAGTVQPGTVQSGTVQPDGSKGADQEIVVISGSRVELHIDQDVLIATRVEYNRSRRTLTVVGVGEYDTVQNGSTQVLKGSGLVVDLGSEALTGEDVIISDAQLEIRGEAVSRVPGQLTASNSYFTPCAKCGRTPNDYAFRARTVLLYPGDRLVAYDAVLLLADVPVLFLPVVILPLQDQNRQPRLSFGQDAIDGFTAAADLPFVIGSSTLGTTLLRYYQNRTPSVGFGVDLHSYAPFYGVDRLDLYALANPRPSVLGSDGTTYVSPGDNEYNLNFSVRGKYPLYGSRDGLTYALTAVRSDVGRFATDPQRGVTDVNGAATADFPSVEFGNVGVQLNYQGRLGPPPTVALPGVLRTEVVVDPGAYRLGNLSADFRVTLGQYTAASNPLSRIAQAQGPNFSTARLEEAHVITFSAQPWDGGTLTFNNTFTGRYYLTGARVVNLLASVSLAQTFSVTNSVRLNYAYTRQEGTSPFAFDAVFTRPPSGILSGDISVTPTPGLTFTASQAYDYVQPRDNQPPAHFGVSVQKEPVSFNLGLDPNFFTGQLETAALDAVVGQNRPLLLGLHGSYTRLGGPGLVSLSADVVGGPRTNTFGVTLNYSPLSRALSSVNVRVSALSAQDSVLNPLSFTANETIGLQTSIPATLPATGDPAAPPAVTPPPLVTQTPSLSGQATLNTSGLVFTASHSLTLPNGNPNSDTVYFGVGSQAGAAFNWSLRYGGNYDVSRLGFTRPAVTGTLTATRLGQRLSAQASLNVPGLDQGLTELSNASVAGSYDLGRAFISGGAYYSRSRVNTGTAAQSVTDTVQFQPLTLTLGLGNGPKPGAYLSAILRQTLIWQDGVLQPPGRVLPILLFTVDRCCWAFQVEINPLDGRYRIGVSLPGQDTAASLFEANPNGLSVPLLTPGR
ncbi:hypothetical protein Q0M94_05740 [Deinococcus radiomollis]|uniref:hypothetical protein n=1 Tax=Deinococcus radiomollis TaxID=468916 RepID=UPI003891C3CB